MAKNGPISTKIGKKILSKGSGILSKICYTIKDCADNRRKTKEALKKKEERTFEIIWHCKIKSGQEVCL